MARTSDHQWTDDALHGNAGWIAGERWTCAACGLERRKAGEAIIYFRDGKRAEGLQGCIQ